ncbi:MAG: 3-dehydroquinate synthase [Lachnospiraceae bacterium]|nr:3-dehydroquinate synthase [Lachnospiraceae bacterium]
MSKRMTVKQNNQPIYDIVMELDYDKLSEELTSIGAVDKKFCIVTDSNVAPFYCETVKKELEKIASKVTVFTFPAGEESKNLDTVRQLYTHLIEEHFERSDMLVALGGGVTGDMTGYTAATYLRGIDFIQLPTSLLAQVDSSIGGKTGVDFDQYKNMVGAFHMPKLVYMNLTTLNTLPKEQFASGMAEVLKSGLIRDGEYYEWVITNLCEIQEMESLVLEHLVEGSCNIKRLVVEKDPKEKGERALLNLGHTIGHAIEKLKNFTLLHGQCVALGTVAAAYISWKRELLSTEEFFEIRDMMVGFDLPISLDGLDANEIVAATKLDKKMENGTVKFILLQAIGKAFITKDVTDQEMTDAINFLLMAEQED